MTFEELGEILRNARGLSLNELRMLLSEVDFENEFPGMAIFVGEGGNLVLKDTTIESKPPYWKVTPYR